MWCNEQERLADFNYKQVRIAKVVDTGHSIKVQRTWLFGANPEVSPGKRDPVLSCITRASQHSSVLIEPGLAAAASHNAGLSLLRELYYFIGSSLSFDPRIRYIPRVQLFPSFRFSHARPSIFFFPVPCTPYIFRVIKDHPRPPTLPSRYARASRIDFRLSCSRHRRGQNLEDAFASTSHPK